MAIQAYAIEVVESGEILNFIDSDGGMVECRVKDLNVPCLGIFMTSPIKTLVPITTTWWPRGASSGFTTLLTHNITDWGFSFYSTAGVYNDFEIDDPNGTESVIETQISITLNADGVTTKGGLYESGFSVGLDIEDVTDPNAPIGVGSGELLCRDRGGDQGLTDVAIGSMAYDRNGDVASYIVKLKRGRKYRIWMKTEAYGAPLLVSEVESGVRAEWTQLSVAVAEEDSTDLLEQHDADIKELMAAQ